MARNSRGGRNAGAAQEDDGRRPLSRKGLGKVWRVFRYVKPYRLPYFIGLFFLMASGATFLAFPLFTGKMINAASVKDFEWVFQDIDQIALVLLVVFAFQGLFSFLRIWLFTHVSEHAIRDLRANVFERLMVLSMTFYDNRRTGELFSRITSDVERLRDTFSTTLAELIRQVIVLVVTIVLLALKMPELTLFMLSTFPVVVIVAMVVSRRIRKLSKATQDELAKTNVVVEESMQSIHVVKAFTNELYELTRYLKGLNKTLKVAVRVGVARGAFIAINLFIILVGIIGVIWYGTRLVAEGAMQIGDLVEFVMYTMFIGGSIAGVGSIYTQVQQAIGAAERVLDILGEEGETTIARDALKDLKLQGGISFDSVRFRYPTRDDVEVLKQVSFTLEPGQKAALVGHSGAGKSTIAQLLLRFYDVQEGRITVDGQDVSSFNLREYRHQIGIVPQEVLLFGGSIRENIAYGKPNATDEELEAAARQANAWEFIQSFPEGLNTLVGERGIKLSGGQRQRIAIARAILKDPTILILDEATSSLDAESEQLVQQALENLMEGRTTIIIAHRLGTIRQADQIFVLEQGQIIEQGTHQELLANQEGTYTNLVRLQLQN